MWELLLLVSTNITRCQNTSGADYAKVTNSTRLGKPHVTVTLSFLGVFSRVFHVFFLFHKMSATQMKLQKRDSTPLALLSAGKMIKIL